MPHPLALLVFLLLAAAPAAAFDIKAGVLHGDTEAMASCPRRCQYYGGWIHDKFTARDRRSTCSCRLGPLGKNDEANAGPVQADPTRAAWACVTACERYGGWAKAQRSVDGQMVCRCQEPLIADPQAVRQ